jgi:hypothetical protein
MKKVVFLFSLFFLLSCSSADEDLNSSDFNPPAWIQGTWMQEGGTQGISMGFRLSTHDLCTIIITAEQCQQELLNLIRKSGQTVSVNETISNSEYVTKINYYGGQSVTYTFKKLSNTEIDYNGAVFIKQ